jgi:hypothetical protein
VLSPTLHTNQCLSCQTRLKSYFFSEDLNVLDNILTTLEGDGDLDQEYDDKKDKSGKYMKD